MRRLRWPRRRPRGRHRAHRHLVAAPPAEVAASDTPELPAATSTPVPAAPVGPPPAPPSGPAVQLGYADGSVLVLEPGSAAFERLRATADRLRAAID